MYLARTLETTADGSRPRVLAADGPGSDWVDVRVAERARLERAGAAPAAALRIAAAVVPESMSAAIAGGEAFLEAAAGAIAERPEQALRSDPRLSAPLDPSGYRDYMIFEEHFSFGYRLQDAPVPAVMRELPVAYLGNPGSFIGPEEEILWPSYSQRLDYELELGIVVGAAATDLEPEAAAEAIFGFTILNDVSARDIQMQEMAGRLGPCKGKHFCCVVGPVIATADEVDWRGGLRMQARINGETVCDADSAEAIWGLDELVAWASQAERIEPGWLLGSGTCNGGSTIELGRELSPGDSIEFEIDGLGILRSTFGAPATGGWMPPVRASV